LDAAAEAALFEYPTFPEEEDDEAALDSSLCVNRKIIVVDFFLVVARVAGSLQIVLNFKFWVQRQEVVAAFSVLFPCYAGVFWRKWAQEDQGAGGWLKNVLGRILYR
jgi:hypothetical protein